MGLIILVGLGLFFFFNRPTGPDTIDPVDPENPEKKPDDYYTNSELRKLSDQEVLARVLYGEGRGLERAELLKIGWVVKNRKRNTRWPNTIKSVILQDRQFGCFDLPITGNSYETRRVVLRNQTEYNKCLSVAKEVLNGSVPNNFRNVYHYTLVNYPYTNGPIRIEDEKIISGGPSWAKGAKVHSVHAHVFLEGLL